MNDASTGNQKSCVLKEDSKCSWHFLTGAFFLWCWDFECVLDVGCYPLISLVGDLQLVLFVLIISKERVLNIILDRQITFSVEC